jgi:hypothetical protein
MTSQIPLDGGYWSRKAAARLQRHRDWLSAHLVPIRPIPRQSGLKSERSTYTFPHTCAGYGCAVCMWIASKK